MPSFKDKVELEDVQAESATPGGGLWIYYEGRRLCIPQSQIDDDSEVWLPGHQGKMIVSEWIAQQKELI